MEDKVAIVLPANRWASPYLNIYTNILKKENIPHNIIYWDRDNSEHDDSEFIRWPSLIRGNSSLHNIINCFFFSLYIRKELSQENYSTVLFLGTTVPVFLYLFSYLQKIKFGIDIRDLGNEQKQPFKFIFSKLIKFSLFNAVSSNGFIKHLPEETYNLSHNIQQEQAPFKGGIIKKKNKICILTIGSIRSFEENKKFITSLANKNGILLKFVGKSETADKLQIYCMKNQIKNVEFIGFYKKEEEQKYLSGVDFINIVLPKDKNSLSLLSNRFYLGIVNQIPVIITHGEHEKYVSKYKIGIIVDDYENLYEKIKQFKAPSPEAYSKILQKVSEENQKFTASLLTFINKRQ